MHFVFCWPSAVVGWVRLTWWLGEWGKWTGPSPQKSRQQPRTAGGMNVMWCLWCLVILWFGDLLIWWFGACWWFGDLVHVGAPHLVEKGEVWCASSHQTFLCVQDQHLFQQPQSGLVSENWKGRFSKIKIQEVEPCEILGRRRGLWSKACQADTWDNAELLLCISWKFTKLWTSWKEVFHCWNQNTNFVQPTRAWLFGAVDIVGYIVAHHHVGANKRPCTNEDATR